MKNLETYLAEQLLKPDFLEEYNALEEEYAVIKTELEKIMEERRMIINSNLEQLRLKHERIVLDYIGLRLAETYQFEELGMLQFEELAKTAFFIWLDSMVDVSFDEICFAMGQLKEEGLNYLDSDLVHNQIWLSK